MGKVGSEDRGGRGIVGAACFGDGWRRRLEMMGYLFSMEDVEDPWIIRVDSIEYE